MTTEIVICSMNMRVETSNNEIKYEAYMDAPEVKRIKPRLKNQNESDTLGSDSFNALENIEAQSGVHSS